MPTQKILVTGGPGFIGRRVVKRFLDNGHEVVSFSLPGEPPALEWARPVEMRYGDVTNPKDTSAAAKGCDLIIHLAALVGHAGDYDMQWRVIAEGTRNICMAAVENRARIVVASSIAVYGEFIQTQTCREDLGHGPWAGAYGRAKQGQETIALEIAEAEGLALILIRPANVYGLGGASAWGDKLIKAIRAGAGALIGKADQNDAGLVFVDNLADAVYAAGTDPAAIGETYNVCDNNGVTWAKFMKDMVGLSGANAAIVEYPLDAVLALVRKNEDPANCVSPADPSLPFMEGVNLVGYSNRIPSDHIREVLGWSPRFSYSQAMDLMREQIETNE